MPLFKCSKCGAMDNTALGRYWNENYRGEPVLCSECGKGKWHGRFEKKPPEEWGYIEGKDGLWYKPSEIAPGGSLSHVTSPKRPS